MWIYYVTSTKSQATITDKPKRESIKYFTIQDRVRKLEEKYQKQSAVKVEFEVIEFVRIMILIGFFTYQVMCDCQQTNLK